MPTPDLDLSHAHVQALFGAKRWQQSLGGNRKEAGWAGHPGVEEWALKSVSQGEQGHCGRRDAAGAEAPSHWGMFHGPISLHSPNGKIKLLRISRQLL